MADVDRLDAAPIVHEEVGRLPEKYRAPLVLCYFEGLTHDQAASQLGWPVGTVRSRLAEARDRLRPRLLRRGVAPSVAILAATGRAEAATAVPAALVSATVAMAVGAGAAGTVPAVAVLVGIALREITIMKLSMVATGIGAAMLVGAVGVAFVSARTQDAEKAVSPRPNAAAVQADAGASNPAAIEPGGGRNSPAGSNLRPANSPRALWAKLNSAEQRFRVAKAAHEAARGGYDQVVAARGEVEVLAAELNTCAEDLRDEVDLLQAQLAIKRADVQAAEAQLAKAVDSHKVTEKLANDKVISQSEVRGSQRSVDIRSAELAKKQAELNEVVLRIKQATRRRDEAIDLTERAKGLVTEHEALPKQPVPETKR